MKRGTLTPFDSPGQRSAGTYVFTVGAFVGPGSEHARTLAGVFEQLAHLRRDVVPWAVGHKML